MTSLVKESLDTTMAISLAGIFGLTLGKGFSVYFDAKQRTKLENYSATLNGARVVQKDIDVVPAGAGAPDFIGPVMHTETKSFTEGPHG